MIPVNNAKYVHLLLYTIHKFIQILLILLQMLAKLFVISDIIDMYNVIWINAYGVKYV